MKRLVIFLLEGNGGSVLVEVDEPEPQGGKVPVARGDVPEQARLTFEQALSKIKPAAEVIITRLRGLSDPPDEVSRVPTTQSIMDARIGGAGAPR